MITEAQKAHVLEHSVDRRAGKDFPEYLKFFTGEVAIKHSRLVNVINQPVIEVLDEFKSGNLGDVIDLYIKLKMEEKYEKSFLGKIKRLFSFKRMPWDRSFIISDLKSALNIIQLKW